MFSPRQILAALLLAVTVAAVPAAAAAGPALPQMFASGTVKLGYRDGAPPFSFREHDGRVLGYSIDLCTRALALIAKARNAPVPRDVGTEKITHTLILTQIGFAWQAVQI